MFEQNRLWPRSFVEIVEVARRYQKSHQYIDAGVEYLKAAHVAPSDEYETAMLQDAWMCQERAGGRISELEAFQ